ncbi:MAG: T9SS type A sorting domain-containing protein, partial [Flavobacteriales bacterium]|nr:T9SS type A sorting domain-containing protein [Flavobacteriales bacterium]
TATRVGTSNTVDIVAYVVELFDGTTVQHGDITISGSDNSSTATITAVDPDYSGYIGPGHLGSQGSSTYTTDDDVGHNWTAFNLTNTTTLTAQRGSTGATTIAPYQVISFANYEVALPVSLVQFTGVRLENGEVLLRWKTASERNNAHFTIQRSSDGKTFSSIGSMPGNGTTNTVREYSFTDYTPLGDDLYYRLIQTDLNGIDHFSNILMIPAILNADMQDFDLRIFPVPTRDVLELELENYAQGMASIAIIDMHGKIWKRQPWSPTSGRDYIRIDVNTLPCGAYVLQLQTQHSAIIRRFVKY